MKVREFGRLAELEPLHRQLGARVVRTVPQGSLLLVKLPPDVSVERAIQLYRSSPLVLFAEPNDYLYLEQTQVTPNDELFPVQWHYPMIGLPAAWAVTVGSPVIVAVIDSGIRFDHPDLAGVTVPGYDFLDDDPDPTDPGCPVNVNQNSHGTHVAGTIAALTNNRTGVAGVAWGGASGVRIMPIRVGTIPGTTDCTAVSMFAVIQGIYWATDRGAKVINMSLGSANPSQAEQEAVNYALGRGVTLVAAAGNEDAPVGFPAAYPGVIAVSAVGCDGVITWYSNFGPEVWVAAPGGNNRVSCGDPNTRSVWSTGFSLATGNGYAPSIGTSMASPHVAGVAALLVSRGFTTPQQIRQRLAETAEDLGAPGFDNFYGYGLVNAAAAVGVENTAQTLRVFTASVAGGSVARLSSMARVMADGRFQINDSATGPVSVVAWQDFNGNGRIDPGDVYGRVDGVVVNPGSPVVGIQVRAQLYAGMPMTVSRAGR
ncbi:Thermophilic serine proteinase [bacterium HR32]|nr:Thermophilic serine proteinase [bacterium HR32]